MKPLLYVGGLTHRVYLATRYREKPNGVIDVQTKYDVTDQVGKVLAELDALGLELRPVPDALDNGDSETSPPASDPVGGAASEVDP